MANILRIDSSARSTDSVSREMTDHFIESWLKNHPADVVTVRDLVKAPPPHISEMTIGGFYTPVDQQTPELKAAVALSDELIDELENADILVISAPMYNFGIPSSLKAYIDQIVRVGRTFVADENGLKGLVSGKKVFILTARGSVYSEGPLAAYDQLVPYLSTILGFLGMTDVSYINTEGTTSGPEVLEKSIAANRDLIQKITAA